MSTDLDSVPDPTPRRGGRGGGSGGRGPVTPEVRISKALSSTLRHNAAKEGLALREDGYANVAELVHTPHSPFPATRLTRSS